MLNPFLQPVKSDKRRTTPLSEEKTAQIYGHSVDSASPRPHMGLWVGRLLIRMGQKLTKQSDELNEIKGQA